MGRQSKLVLQIAAKPQQILVWQPIWTVHKSTFWLYVVRHVRLTTLAGLLVRFLADHYVRPMPLQRRVSVCVTRNSVFATQNSGFMTRNSAFATQYLIKRNPHAQMYSVQCLFFDILKIWSDHNGEQKFQCDWLTSLLCNTSVYLLQHSLILLMWLKHSNNTNRQWTCVFSDNALTFVDNNILCNEMMKLLEVYIF